MSTGGELVSMVQEWMMLEKEIKSVQSKLRELRAHQKSATSRLVNVMKENEIDCLDIKDGRLSHRTLKSRSTVSRRHLLTAISTFFEHEQDAELSSKLTEHIMNTREVKEKDKISLSGVKK